MNPPLRKVKNRRRPQKREYPIGLGGYAPERDLIPDSAPDTLSNAEVPGPPPMRAPAGYNPATPAALRSLVRSQNSIGARGSGRGLSVAKLLLPDPIEPATCKDDCDDEIGDIPWDGETGNINSPNSLAGADPSKPVELRPAGHYQLHLAHIEPVDQTAPSNVTTAPMEQQSNDPVNFVRSTTDQTESQFLSSHEPWADQESGPDPWDQPADLDLEWDQQVSGSTQGDSQALGIPTEHVADGTSAHDGRQYNDLESEQNSQNPHYSHFGNANDNYQLDWIHQDPPGQQPEEDFWNQEPHNYLNAYTDDPAFNQNAYLEQEYDDGLTENGQTDSSGLSNRYRQESTLHEQGASNFENRERYNQKIFSSENIGQENRQKHPSADETGHEQRYQEQVDGKFDHMLDNFERFDVHAQPDNEDYEQTPQGYEQEVQPHQFNSYSQHQSQGESYEQQSFWNNEQTQDASVHAQGTASRKYSLETDLFENRQSSPYINYENGEEHHEYTDDIVQDEEHGQNEPHEQDRQYEQYENYAKNEHYEQHEQQVQYEQHEEAVQTYHEQYDQHDQHDQHEHYEQHEQHEQNEQHEQHEHYEQHAKYAYDHQEGNQYNYERHNKHGQHEQNYLPHTEYHEQSDTVIYYPLGKEYITKNLPFQEESHEGNFNVAQDEESKEAFADKFANLQLLDLDDDFLLDDDLLDDEILDDDTEPEVPAVPEVQRAPAKLYIPTQPVASVSSYALLVHSTNHGLTHAPHAYMPQQTYGNAPAKFEVNAELKKLEEKKKKNDAYDVPAGLVKPVRPVQRMKSAAQIGNDSAPPFFPPASTQFSVPSNKPKAEFFGDLVEPKTAPAKRPAPLLVLEPAKPAEVPAAVSKAPVKSPQNPYAQLATKQGQKSGAKPKKYQPAQAPSIPMQQPKKLHAPPNMHGFSGPRTQYNAQLQQPPFAPAPQAPLNAAVAPHVPNVAPSKGSQGMPGPSIKVDTGTTPNTQPGNQLSALGSPCTASALPSGISGNMGPSNPYAPSVGLAGPAGSTVVSPVLQQNDRFQPHTRAQGPQKVHPNQFPFPSIQNSGMQHSKGSRSIDGKPSRDAYIPNIGPYGPTSAVSHSRKSSVMTTAKDSNPYAPPQAHNMGNAPQVNDMNASLNVPVLGHRASNSFDRGHSFQKQAKVFKVDPNTIFHKQIPLFSWGTSNKVVTVIPSVSHLQVYSTSVRISKFSDLELKFNCYNDFPGPLTKSKTKKKDVEQWLQKHTEELRANGASQDEQTLAQILLTLLRHDGAFFTAPLQRDLAAVLAPHIDFTPDNEGIINSVPSIAPNAHKLDSAGSNVVWNYIQSGNTSSALQFALSKEDYPLAIVLAQSLGQNVLMNVCSDLARKRYPVQTTHGLKAQHMMPIFLRLFVGNVKGVIEDFVNISSEGDFAIKFYKEIIAAVIVNGPNQEFLVEFGKFLCDKGMQCASEVCFIIAGILPSRTLLTNGAVFTGAGTFTLSLVYTEVYEYIMSCSPNTPPPVQANGFPHILPLKIKRAQELADLGHFTAARRYCDHIGAVLRALGKTVFISPQASADFQRLVIRLSDCSSSDSSWIGSTFSKVNLDSMWGTLDKLIGGESSSSKPEKGVFSNFSPSLSRNTSQLDVSQIPTSAQRQDNHLLSYVGSSAANFGIPSPQHRIGQHLRYASSVPPGSQLHPNVQLGPEPHHDMGRPVVSSPSVRPPLGNIGRPALGHDVTNNYADPMSVTPNPNVQSEMPRHSLNATQNSIFLPRTAKSPRTPSVDNQVPEGLERSGLDARQLSQGLKRDSVASLSSTGFSAQARAPRNPVTTHSGVSSLQSESHGQAVSSRSSNIDEVLLDTVKLKTESADATVTKMEPATANEPNVPGEMPPQKAKPSLEKPEAKAEMNAADEQKLVTLPPVPDGKAAALKAHIKPQKSNSDYPDLLPARRKPLRATRGSARANPYAPIALASSEELLANPEEKKPQKTGQNTSLGNLPGEAPAPEGQAIEQASPKAQNSQDASRTAAAQKHDKNEPEATKETEATNEEPQKAPEAPEAPEAPKSFDVSGAPETSKGPEAPQTSKPGAQGKPLTPLARRPQTNPYGPPDASVPVSLNPYAPRRAARSYAPVTSTGGSTSTPLSEEQRAKLAAANLDVSFDSGAEYTEENENVAPNDPLILNTSENAPLGSNYLNPYSMDKPLRANTALDGFPIPNTPDYTSRANSVVGQAGLYSSKLSQNANYNQEYDVKDDVVPGYESLDEDEEEELPQSAKEKKPEEVPKRNLKSKKSIFKMFSGAEKQDDKPKPTKANLGNESTFVYNEELRRWIDTSRPLEEQLKEDAPPPPPMKKTQTSKPAATGPRLAPSNVSGGPARPDGPRSIVPAVSGGPITLEDLIQAKAPRRKARRNYVNELSKS